MKKRIFINLFLLALLFLVFNFFAPQVLAYGIGVGLTDYYSFNHSNANDSVGTHNGTDTSVTYSTANGKVGVGGRISNLGFADLTSLVGVSSTFTYNMWIEPGTQANAYNGVYGKGDGLNNNEMYLKTNQLAVYTSAFGGDVSIDPVTSPTINVSGSVWTMVTMSYSAATGLNVYVNGVLAQTTAAKGTGVSTTTGSFVIGKDPANAGRTYTGNYDELSIWNTVLSASQISQLYASGFANPYPFTVSPNFWVSF